MDCDSGFNIFFEPRKRMRNASNAAASSICVDLISSMRACNWANGSIVVGKSKELSQPKSYYLTCRHVITASHCSHPVHDHGHGAGLVESTPGHHNGPPGYQCG